MTMLPAHAPSQWMLVFGSVPRASDAGALVPQKSPDVSYVSRHMRKRTIPPMTLLLTHAPPPPLWILVLGLAPRASGVDLLVRWKPPGVDYISRRVRHDRPPPDTSEDVDIL